jgi:hypothetical protein
MLKVQTQIRAHGADSREHASSDTHIKVLFNGPLRAA